MCVSDSVSLPWGAELEDPAGGPALPIPQVRVQTGSVLPSSPPATSQGSPKACAGAQVCIKAVDASWDWAQAWDQSCADSLILH